MDSWWISKDLIMSDAVGMWNGKEETLEECKESCLFKFRMSDDDDEVYYVGYASDDSSFDPLDDFGMPNAGCTTIEYYNIENGSWEVL